MLSSLQTPQVFADSPVIPRSGTSSTLNYFTYLFYSGENTLCERKVSTIICIHEPACEKCSCSLGKPQCIDGKCKCEHYPAEANHTHHSFKSDDTNKDTSNGKHKYDEVSPNSRDF